MKKSLLAILSLAVLATACNQQTPSEPAKTESAPITQTEAPKQTDHHNHKDEHANHSHDHSHEGHTHEHHEGEKYTCDNNKNVTIAVHNHEGEIEAHATIDGIEYDLHPDSQKANTYVSQEEGINDQGMIMTLDNNTAKFYDLANKPLLNCTK